MDTLRKIKLDQLRFLDAALTEISVCTPVWRKNALTCHEPDARRGSLLFFLMRGGWSYTVGGQPVLELHAGDALFLPAGCRYISRCTADGTTGICIDFTIRDAQGAPVALGDAPALLGRGAQAQEPLFRAARSAFAQGDAGCFCCKAAVFRLLAELCVPPDADSAGAHSGIAPALTLLQNHPESDISVPRLAAMCYLGESQFRRVFRACTGHTPIAYRNELRMRRAEALLERGYSVEAAAEALGFTDSAHFCKTWRRLRGTTPGHRK